MSTAPLGLAELEAPAHICLAHYGEQELRRRLFEFVRPALERTSEGVLLLGVAGVPARLLSYLEDDSGRELQGEVSGGRIVLGHGNSDADKQLEDVLGALEALAAGGRAPIRVFGVAAWAVPGFPAPEDLLWYESRLNVHLADYPALIVCAYDVTRLPAAALVYGGLETHPFFLARDSLSPNSQFIPSDRYLRERLVRLPWLEGRGVT